METHSHLRRHAAPGETEPHTAWVERAAAGIPGAVRQLSGDEQQVIIGHYFEGLPLQVLAEELGVHPERAQHLLETALRTLRRALGE